MEDFISPLDSLETTVALDTPTSLALNASASAALAREKLPAPGENQLSASVTAAAMRQDRLSRPMATSPAKLSLGSVVEGFRGGVQSAGDAGSVDQITREIIRQLEKGKVLVVWVMDASGSLQSRREKVIARFDRICKELGDLLEARDAPILNGVVAFGHKTQFLTAKPTADFESLKKAVRSIKADESGEENIFSAVREVALSWRKYQTHGRRTFMIVVLTDERGDDLALLDDTVELALRNKVLVYVIGPMAPFGRNKVNVLWRDPSSGTMFPIPVDRGPESVQPEHLTLPFWGAGPQFDLFASGTGPYALTRLARQSGGLYFLLDDGSIPGPTFDVYDMLEYSPDNVSLAEYVAQMNKNPLRAAIVQAAKASQGAVGTPPMRFTMANLAAELNRAQQPAAQTEHFVERALAILRPVESERSKETAKRWQAHYDLMIGRLLAAKVRCNEYNWALAVMKKDPRPPKSEKNNAWELAGAATIAFGKSQATAKAKTNVTRTDPKATERAKEDAAMSERYLRRVLDDHPGTPWALMAQRELTVPLGFEWKETYIPPPPKPGSPEAKAEAAKQMSRAEVKLPKL